MEETESNEAPGNTVMLGFKARAERLHRACQLAGYAQQQQQLGDGASLTLGELRAMALRQQQQIDSQHQLLCAKEQRLRYLQQHELRQHQVAVEGERLRRLRERVEAQELKLRRLRALRGQIDRNKQANIALTSDLESIRALFNEKEKELSVAVAKVEELTRQLEELRRARVREHPSPPAHELDKLRRELMYRNKLNEQQNGRLSAQRAALGARQEEMRSIDRRVSELQARLLRKRALNRQLAAAHRQHPAPAAAGSVLQQRANNTSSSAQYLSGVGGLPSGRGVHVARGNVAAVEPYHHVPAPSPHSHNHQGKQSTSQNNAALKQLAVNDDMLGHFSHPDQYLQQKQYLGPMYDGGYGQPTDVQQLHQYQGLISHKYDINTFAHVQQGVAVSSVFDVGSFPEYNKQSQYSPNSTTSSNSNQTGKELKLNDQEFLPEFVASKSDPKYQTLPYNTKFLQTSNGKLIAPEPTCKGNENDLGHLRVAASGPLAVLNKSLSTLAHHETPISDSSSTSTHEEKENVAHPPNPRLNQGTDSSKCISTKTVQGNSSNTTAATGAGSIGFGKPVSSVAPTSVQVSCGKPSPIYQSSSTKIQPVQPQTVQVQSLSVSSPSPNHLASNMTTSQPQIVRNTVSGLSQHSTGSASVSSQSMLQLSLSPLAPQSTSTPLSTPDVSGADTGGDKSPKPALPPKPVIKTPPRQSVSCEVTTAPTQDSAGDGEHSHSQKDTSNGSSNNEMIIKARPLTIRKPPSSEQPKLKNVNNSKNGPSIAMSMNRRIEMPPAFLFPEMDHLARESALTDIQPKEKTKHNDEVDKALTHAHDNEGSLTSNEKIEDSKDAMTMTSVTEQISSVDLNGQNSENVSRRSKKGNLKQAGKAPLTRRVSFDPLALLLDASLEGELELVKKTATQVQNASAANDEGITALHNAICAGHFEIVKFLVELGCDVNAQDSDGWTPLHCAASCNNLPMVRFLVDNGACIFATTLSDHETAAEKCEEDEEGFDGCSEYLYSVQEKLGIMNNGLVYAVFSYSAARADELSFECGARLQVLRKGDDSEREWWWCRDVNARDGYVPRNLLGLYPRVAPQQE